LNYYERHIGDYLKDTSHLSLLEHGIYGRLLDVYYTREGAIPDAQAARLIGARSKEEREALSAVLAEFFTLTEGHWHQARCDIEVEAYQAKQAEKPATKENAKERQRRTRERREKLFEALRSHGITMQYNATTRELEAELSRVTKRDTSQPVTRDECVTSGDVTPPVTRHDTATHTPDTRHQSPDPNTTHTESSPPELVRVVSLAGQACMAMKGRGVSDVNPGNPDLLMLIEAGAALEEFEGAATLAVGKSKGFAYAIGIVKRSRSEAAKTSQQMHKGPMPAAPASAAAVMLGAHRQAQAKPVNDPNTIDME
jgi:uncharacterized protein YdaU (DUF1376 family)